MTLSEYLDREGLTLDAFGRRIGFSAVTVHKWTAGKTFPRPDNLRAIERVTRGAVTAADFLGSPQQPRRERAA